MAIVEDEMRNESEEENEIEVVVEEDDGDQDSEDSDDDDDDEVLERKVSELEQKISEDPYHYDDHIDLIQALWGLSELERWRAAFDRLQKLSAIRAEHWLLRLQTEITLGHSAQARERIDMLFQHAALDCYSIPILSEWCTWALSGAATEARAALETVLRRAGPDPLSGRIFWDAKLELEKSQLDTMSAEDPEYKAQQERVLWCAEEALARPLLQAAGGGGGEDGGGGGGDGPSEAKLTNKHAWPPLKDLATKLRGENYLEKVQKQHEVAMEYLKKITPFEDKLLTLESVEDKCATYQEYIDKVKELSKDDKYAECDSDGILKVLYDRATTECLTSSNVRDLLQQWAKHALKRSSRSTYSRVLDSCTRRCPTVHIFWTLKMQHAENEGKTFDEIKQIFETALSKGMESYKEAESLWLSYLEYIRRHTAFDSGEDLDRIRSTFRLAWDSLAEAWGEEANDSEVPLYWARLEYKRMNDPKRGKDIFEEIFNYGENKTMSKYWEALISLESSRSPKPSEHKTRDLLRRALRFVADYPPAVARLWTDYERDYGQLHTMQECSDACDTKIKEWRDNYQALKDKMTGQKHKGKSSNKQPSKKTKFDNKKKKKDEESLLKGKRKSDDTADAGDVKRKRDGDIDVEKADTGGGVKRSHDDSDDDDGGAGDNKRMRSDSGSSESRSAARDACTLFVSNLDFKVDEQRLRDVLGQYGDIVSMRVKAGVKAFGGSICYCQYKTPESVDEALKHDRRPLDGRPMFLSRYSMKKTKPSFKYPTTAEKNKLFVKNLPFTHCTKDKLKEVFDKDGKLKDVRIVTFKDGKPKGLAYIEYEDEDAAESALKRTNGLLLGERKIDVAFSAPPPRKDVSVTIPAAALGQPKREPTGGMRRTQLSSFIPSVLQKPSTSKANGSQSNGSAESTSKQPLTNADFRSMLLK